MFHLKFLFIISILNLSFEYAACEVVYSAVFYQGVQDSDTKNINTLMTTIGSLEEALNVKYRDSKLKDISNYLNGTETVKKDGYQIFTHSLDEQSVNILVFPQKCSYHEKYMQEYKQSAEYENSIQKFKPLMRSLKGFVGKKDSATFEDIEKIYYFIAEDELQNIDIRDFYSAVCYSISITTANRQIARLKAGPIFKEIFAKLQQAQSSKNIFTMDIYQVNIYGIINILNSLNIYDLSRPDGFYAVFIEVHKEGKSYYARITSLDENEDETVWRIPLCERLCTVDRFLKLYDDLLPKNWDEECVKEVNDVLLVIVISGTTYLIIILILILNIAIAFRHRSLKKKAESDAQDVEEDTIKIGSGIILESKLEEHGEKIIKRTKSIQNLNFLKISRYDEISV